APAAAGFPRRPGMPVPPVPPATGARPVASGDPTAPRHIVLMKPAGARPGQANGAHPAAAMLALAGAQAQLGSTVVYASDVLPWRARAAPRAHPEAPALHPPDVRPGPTPTPSPAARGPPPPDPAVQQVRAERWLRPILKDSIPQIGADVVWQTGSHGEGRMVA